MRCWLTAQGPVEWAMLIFRHCYDCDLTVPRLLQWRQRTHRFPSRYIRIFDLWSVYSKNMTDLPVLSYSTIKLWSCGYYNIIVMNTIFRWSSIVITHNRKQKYNCMFSALNIIVIIIASRINQNFGTQNRPTEL